MAVGHLQVSAVIVKGKRVPVHLPLAVVVRADTHAIFSCAVNVELRNGLWVPAGLAVIRSAMEPCPH